MPKGIITNCLVVLIGGLIGGILGNKIPHNLKNSLPVRI